MEISKERPRRRNYKPLIKRVYLRDYAIEWGSDTPESVLTHLLSLCDLLSGYVDQDSVHIGKLAHRIVHNPDAQNAIICLVFKLNQLEANEFRKKNVGKRKLESIKK